MNPDLPGRLRSTPDVYLQKIDLVRDAGLIIQFDRGAYRAASFLDDRILGPQTQGGWSSLARIVGLAQEVERTRPLHFIFHAGHVGSTLLSRLLDETGVVLSLREPSPLRTLADAHDASRQIDALLSVEQVGALQRALLRLWSRGYDADAAVVLKATSSASRIAPALLLDERGAHAVFLNVKPQVYLATLLAGQNSAIDLRGHGAVRIRGLQARVQAPLQPLHALSVGELAAMSWLAEALNEAELHRAAPDRLLSLDFDQLLVNVEDAVARVLERFALPVDRAVSGALAHSPVLTRYSKAAEFEYSPQVRTQVLNESYRMNVAEIRKGIAWLDALARTEDNVAAALDARR